MTTKAIPEDRFEAMLEERFSLAGRRGMADRVAAHDQNRRPAVFDLAGERKHIRFDGDIPPGVKTAVLEWTPELLSFCDGQGLELHDFSHDILVSGKEAYEKASGAPVPPSVPMPASSYRYHPLDKHYAVQLVVAPKPTGEEEALAVLRVLFSRLLGDIYLREKVLCREPYREETARGATQVTAGMREKLLLLSGEPPTDRGPLTNLITDYAKRAGINPKKMADQARKGFFKESMQELERQMIPPSKEAAIDQAYGAALAAACENLPQTLAQTVAAVEEFNGQLTFLPVDGLPHTLRLKHRNPAHYLRVAQARLEFVLQGLDTAIESFDELQKGDSPLAGVMEEQVTALMDELTTQNLARPYLVEKARLSPRMEAARKRFPLEVHTLLRKMPLVADKARMFAHLSKKMRANIYQRLYVALAGLKQWIQQQKAGEGAGFIQSERYKELKAAVYNFRFRRESAEALHVRSGIVLDLAEAADPDELSGKTRPIQRIPLEDFTRGWSHYISHQVIGQFLSAHPQKLPGFQPDRYFKTVDGGVVGQLQKGGGHYPLVYLLFCLHRLAETRSTENGGLFRGLPGGAGLAFVTDLMRNPFGTFRFAVLQALRP
ncbi:MAG: hypothetical protein OEW12_06265, partial [Deltaproteobacteria bacterium]|nr:hypothetical protein [Deltaproteobacteria bacterium]